GITSQSVAKVAQTGARQPQRKKFQNVQQYAPFSARRRQYPRPWPSAPFHLGEPGLQWRTGADVGGDRLGLCREAAAAWRSIYEASRSPRRDCRSCWPRSRPWAELGMASTPRLGAEGMVGWLVRRERESVARETVEKVTILCTVDKKVPDKPMKSVGQRLRYVSKTGRDEKTNAPTVDRPRQLEVGPLPFPQGKST